MSRLFSRQVWWLLIGLLVAGGAGLPAWAQPVPHPGDATGPVARTNTVPLPPPIRSPVDYFRELLAMTPRERRDALTNRTDEGRKLILAKVREYESMRPDDRELRLRVTELRWHLMPLLQIDPTNRTSQLALVSPEDRALLDDRLAAWDRLSPSVQRELLDNEATVRYFSELQTGSQEQQRKALESMSEARRQKLQQGIVQWRALSPGQQARITANFVRFFDLSATEKTRALSSLSEAERRQIERTLKAYESLPPGQRAQCIRSFEKFTSLTLEERQQFLKNAERWKLMSPAERQNWRNLVAQISLMPPTPHSGDFPPLPRSVRPVRPAPAPPAVVTNR